MTRNKIAIFDTTLRDGAQTPGLGFNFKDRYYIAKALANIGVDVVEIGFGRNDVELPYIEELAKYIGNRKHSSNLRVPVVCSLARPLKEDVESAYKAIENADPDKRRVHVFIGTSEELMSYSHGMREKRILELISEGVSYARELVGSEGQVEYSSEDALRTDFDFLAQTIQTAIDCGASTINIPDTTGFVIPDVYYNTIMKLGERVKGFDGIEKSAHIHNDSGLAVACTLKGIEAGIRQVEGCVNQLGERAGNLDWITLVTDLNKLGDHYNADVSHIISSDLYKLAKLVSTIAGHPLPLTHPVTGQAAFSESSGIHVKGVLKNYQTYFVIPPESVGREVSIELGQTSGTNTTANFLRIAGYGEAGKDYSLKKLEDMTSAVKKYSIEIKDTLTETESRLLAEHYILGKPLEERLVLKSSKSSKVADELDNWSVVELGLDGKELIDEGFGNGTVDSFMNAVRGATGMHNVELYHWEESAVYSGKGAYGYELVDEMDFTSEEERLLHDNGYESKGQEAVAKSMIQLLYDGEIFYGRGSGKDIVDATKEAIINGFDAIYRLKAK